MNKISNSLKTQLRGLLLGNEPERMIQDLHLMQVTTLEAIKDDEVPIEAAIPCTETINCLTSILSQISK